MTRTRKIIVWSGGMLYLASFAVPFPAGLYLAAGGILIVLRGVSPHVTLTTKETQ